MGETWPTSYRSPPISTEFGKLKANVHINTKPSERVIMHLYNVHHEAVVAECDALRELCLTAAPQPPPPHHRTQVGWVLDFFFPRYAFITTQDEAAALSRYRDVTYITQYKHILFDWASSKATVQFTRDVLKFKFYVITILMASMKRINTLLNTVTFVQYKILLAIIPHSFLLDNSVSKVTLHGRNAWRFTTTPPAQTQVRIDLYLCLKINVKSSLCFNWAPRHKRVLGRGGIAPLILWPRH
jgi:hypothetical protein